MQQQSAAGYEDANALFQRARRRCDDIRPARAIVMATASLGPQPAGRRTRRLGIDLMSMSERGSSVWRINVPWTARRAVASPRAAVRRRALTTLDATGWGGSTRTYSADPTRLVWQADLQSQVALELSRSRDVAVRARAQVAVRSFEIGSRAARLSRAKTHLQLRIAVRIATTSLRLRDPRTERIARSIALRAYARVRGARQRGWSRVDGAWSTLPQHKMLVNLSSSLLRAVPHTRTSRDVDALRRATTTPAQVTFRRVPKAEFYPWPRDGAFDEQAVSIAIDKPATASLVVFAANGSVLRTTSAPLLPGVHRLAWDGADDSGTIAGAGSYRYNVTTIDLAGNRGRIPGLEQFVVARDTTAPTVVSSSVRVVGAGSARRVIAAWHVNEVHSPNVRSWLLLRSSDRRVSVKLHDHMQKATVRRHVALETGTWRATFVFIDGSGNRTQRAVAPFVVR